ncbi:MAG: fused MFS/spermidine synthase, partial [Dehalococcoidia bacterium]|nr:fused MFS/spermidine synthase [Dehalococcoidia bacterium]
MSGELSGKWLHDALSPDLVELHRINRVFCSGQTKYQKFDVVETASYGLTLLLDGKIQSAERDEFVYHDALVHPAMITHHGPENVFIGGGGEGATLREVLKHRSVRRVVMVDIDREVVEMSKSYLPAWSDGAFEDPRLELVHTDARKYLEETRERFDVLVLDFPDPLEGGPAYLLFTKEFYQLLTGRLAPAGIIALQAGDASYNNCATFLSVVNTLKTVFPVVRPYAVHVPSFSSPWGFATASFR